MAVITTPMLPQFRRNASNVHETATPPEPRAARARRLLLGPALAAALTGSAVVLAAGSASAQTPQKIAVVDVRRAVMETEEGLRVSSTLKRLFDNRQVELDQKQRQLQTD
jgi:outer membrane protein